MKIFLKDLFKLAVILTIWYVSLGYCKDNDYYRAHEALKYFPFHLVVTIGYYAVISVCYNILFIRDCEKEFDELVEDIKEGRNFFKQRNIKYN